MEKSINRLGEFKDKKLEKEYHDDQVFKGIRVSRNIILIFCILHLLFFISDYFFILDIDTAVIIKYSLVHRIIVLVLGIIVYVLLTNPKDKTKTVPLILVFTLVVYLLHEYVAVKLAPVSIMSEAFNLLIVTLCLFMIPNRWIFNVITACLLFIIFIALIPWTIPNVIIGSAVNLIIYLVIHIVVISALIYQNGKQRRLNYLQQLQLEILVKTDTLTKASNRAACDSILNEMCAGHVPFSLILFDIDDFKRINDTYGHMVGDDVIVKMVDTVKAAVRQEDIVARWGGEEFIVILPKTTLRIAKDIANRLRELIEEIEHDKVTGKVTASFGVTEFGEGDEKRKLISRVDQLLYLAKEYGKNRVIAG
ncbi:GGDEF domain-containing protein [Dehalobacter sp. DCM]|uniref:GGDEF domain-containing protein n=1 Tax=Dehalobacter sp. DCM TaxID=2907827 RepID=UPI0030815F87|nr:GGDEF domain-containing protein [Dehalobacter sp. DCM]